MEPDPETFKVNHTPELREVLDRKPIWPIRWGNTVILFALLAIIILANTIQFSFPYTLKSQMVGYDNRTHDKEGLLIFEVTPASGMVIKTGDAIEICNLSQAGKTVRAGIGEIKNVQERKIDGTPGLTLTVKLGQGQMIQTREHTFYYLSGFEKRTLLQWISNRKS